ncbi:sulfatase [Hirschia litorea]|uniref:Sulfatase n=1 Tax=Hirschia litorea TaxID=1199156 RepID=A0ABW2IQ26_9PROT
MENKSKRSARSAMRMGLTCLMLGAFASVACAKTPANEVELAASEIVQDKRPNILWIMSEDMGPELGIYGTPETITPNLDALAKKGQVYEQAFTNAPICSISRSSLYTGMYQTSIGAHQHRTPEDRKKPLPEGVKLLTDHFRDAGYFTSLIKKIERDDGPDGWFEGKLKTDWNFTYEGEPYDTNALSDLKANQPFFAHVQFPETHRGKDWDNAKNVIDHPADPAKVDLPPYYPDTPTARDDWADYLDAVMAFDRKSGVVLRRLKEEGLDKNTIVIVLSDHGRAMVRGKQWLYDSGLHIPLFIYIPEGLEKPKGYKAGSRTDMMVSGIDITATTLELAGIDPGLVMQGRAFLGDDAVQRTYTFAARDRADETVDYMRSVRDARYRYIRNYMPERPYTQLNGYKEAQYPVLREMFRLYRDGKLGQIPSLFMAPKKPVEELFDTKTDPHNVVNLANDPKYAAKLVEMRAALATWEVETNDQGRFPEPADIAASIHEKTEKKRAPEYQALVDKEGPWREGQ